MQELFLSNDLLIASDQQTRHIFSLGDHFQQRPFAFAHGADHFFEGAAALGYFSGVNWACASECWVANLDPRKLGDAIAAHFVIDLDTEQAPAAELPSFDELADQLAECLGDQADLDGHMPNVVLVGCQPADKGHAWSVHAHFPDLHFDAPPPRSFIDAINKLGTVRAYGLKADKSIYTNGIRFGPTSKPLRPGWRAELPVLLLPATTWRDAFPLHDAATWARFECTWRHADRAPMQRTAQGAAAAALIDMEDPLVVTALQLYRLYMDPQATVQSRGLVERTPHQLLIYFTDVNARCPHRGNNHYGVINLLAHTMEIRCGASHDLYATVQMPPMAPRGEHASYVQQLLEWLRAVKHTSVATPWTLAEFATLMQEPPYPISRSPTERPRALCIEVEVFNELRAAGADNDVLCRYINLAATFVLDSGGLFAVKDANGNVALHKRQTVIAALAAFQVDGKKKPVAFLPIAEQLEANTTFPELGRYRVGDPAIANVLDPRRIVIVKRVPPAPGTEVALQAEVALWWRVYMRALVFNSVHAVHPEVDVREDLAVWILMWAIEVLFGHRPLGVCLVLAEPRGGAGKTLLFAILSAILGDHETHSFTNMKQFLNEGFSYDYIRRRLFSFDDGATGGGDMSAVKDFVTRHKTSANIKFGSNGVRVDVAGALLWLTNRFGINQTALTSEERRFLCAAPAKAYLDVIDDLPEDERATCLATFGRSHSEFLAYGYDNFTGNAVSDHLRALSVVLHQTYLNRLEQLGEQDLCTPLRLMVESQQLLTTVRHDALVSSFGPLGAWILDCIEAGSFQPAEFRGIVGTDIHVSTEKPVAITPDGLEMPALWRAETLRVLFLGSVPGNQHGLDAQEASSERAFGDAFVRAFNGIHNGRELAKRLKPAHRGRHFRWALPGHWVDQEPTVLDRNVKQSRGWLRIDFPAVVDRMDEGDE